MKKQHQQSYADKEADTLSLEELLDSVEQTEQQANAALNENQAEIDKANNRRDFIVFLTLKGIDITHKSNIVEVAKKFETDVSTVAQDLHTLSNKVTWKQHKARLKDKINQQLHRKSALVIARKNDISNKMLQSFSFDEDSLVNLAHEFECRPSHIVDDIRHFKKFSTQKKLLIEQQSKAPVIKAFSRFARFNIKY
ncbi:hypothetical protein [Shewanella gaetbuli]|uniref:Uncharacterized protein n=1 Tax=Shewanella gaetbuli TaxID=220752 RepID=A0A9X1ZHH6_9GAMM|nr:hypothetical protein [Shewanella gaetbuli]MCL1142404.1 hypothetical protein [Shewanella gaetbuli]